MRSKKYRPHIVIGDPTDRELREDVLSNAQLIYEGDGQYLGVAFSDVDQEPNVGVAVTCVVDLIYFPQVSYRDVRLGAVFTLREGARVVGYGKIVKVFGLPV